MYKGNRDPDPQILQDNKEPPAFESGRLRSTSFEFARIWHQASSFGKGFNRQDSSWIEAPDWEAERSRLLSRQISNRLDSHDFSQHCNRQHGTKRVRSWCDNHHSSISSFASLGFGILQEPVTAFPATSQTEDINQRCSQNNYDDDLEEKKSGANQSGPTLQEVLEGCTEETSHPDSKKFLGRRPLQKRVWPLGDLPCIAFTAQDTLTDHAASPNIKALSIDPVVKEGIQRQPSGNILDLISGDDFSYSYLRRSVGGLRLPIDIQIIFMVTPPADSNNGHNVLQPAAVQNVSE